MSKWMLDLQSVVMRGIGVRKLEHALDLKSNAIHGDLATRLDAMRAEAIERDRLATERLDALQRRVEEVGGQLSQQGRADTERGDTVQNMLGDLRAAIGDLRASVSRGDDVVLALGDLRAEMSALRADVAREFERLDERPTGPGDGGSLAARAS